jgi:hypothetical protein
MGRHNHGFQLAGLDAAIWLGNAVGVVLVGMGMRPSLLNRLGGASLEDGSNGVCLRHYAQPKAWADGTRSGRVNTNWPRGVEPGLETLPMAVRTDRATGSGDEARAGRRLESTRVER